MPDFPFIVPLNDKENLSSPNDNKVSHPIIKNLMVKRSNSMINESFFSEAEATPSLSNFLSPDLAGVLFPKEIDTNQVNMERIENLCKTFRGYCDKYSFDVTSNDSILPSPCINDSEIIGSFKPEPFALSRSLSFPVTPPSNFKWNRKEFRSNHVEEESKPSNLSADEDSNDEYIPERNHFESTQIFDNEICLADNLSMRRLSRITFKTHSNDDNSNVIINRNSYKGKPLKSFLNNSKISNSSGFFSLGESSLSTNNTNSSENHIIDNHHHHIGVKTNQYSPYYRSSPSKPTNRKVYFDMNVNLPISPIGKPSSIANNDNNKGILKNSNLIQLNDSMDFSNSIIEIDSPVFDNSINHHHHHSFKRYDLNGSDFIAPKLIDLDISPIHSDTD